MCIGSLSKCESDRMELFKEAVMMEQCETVSGYYMKRQKKMPFLPVTYVLPNHLSMHRGKKTKKQNTWHAADKQEEFKRIHKKTPALPQYFPNRNATM